MPLFSPGFPLILPFLPVLGGIIPAQPHVNPYERAETDKREQKGDQKGAETGETAVTTFNNFNQKQQKGRLKPATESPFQQHPTVKRVDVPRGESLPQGLYPVFKNCS